MSEYIRIRNWERFQYRSDKPLPWIKDYDAQLSDPEYTELSFAERGFLHDLRLLANRRGNRILNDPGYIRRMLSGRGPNAERMVASLLARGFLESCESSTETPANPVRTDAFGADGGRTPTAPDVERELEENKDPVGSREVPLRLVKDEEPHPDDMQTLGESGAIDAFFDDLERRRAVTTGRNT